jgi:RNA polymerase sigma factor (sigma-70 family)
MIEQDTAYRKGQSQFPPTAWDLLARLRDPKDPGAKAYLDQMIEAYWRPVYKYVRIGWKRSNEDAKDLTQAFFVHLLEGTLLARADPERGNFRKLLMTALKNFLSNEARAGQAVKRGGGQKILSLEGSLDLDPASDPQDPQAAFDAQWAREVLGRAIDRLREHSKADVFRAFQRFHLENAAVREIASELRASEVQVAHYLQDARAHLRRIVTDQIRVYVRDEGEIAKELDTLFGAWK